MPIELSRCFFLRSRYSRARFAAANFPPSRDASRDGANVTNEVVTVFELMTSEESKKEKSVNTRARGTRLPEGAELTEEFITAAIDLGAPPRIVPIVWAEFVDFWSAVPGQRGVKLNWLSTWRNRIRQKFHLTTTKGNGDHGRRTIHEVARDNAASFLDQLNAAPPDGLCEPAGGRVIRMLPAHGCK